MRGTRCGCQLVALVTVAAVMAAAPAQGADFSWAGGGTTAQTGMSLAANWAGGAAPSGSVGTLTFAALSDPACAASPVTKACYSVKSDVAGLAADGIVVDHHYVVSGATPMSLGSGGLTVTPTGAGTSWQAPLSLTAPQTWHISPSGQYFYAGPVSGASALTVEIAQSSGMYFADAEVGPVTLASGPGVAKGFVGLSPSAKVNATNGQPVHLDGANHGIFLFSFGGQTGPLTTAGGTIQVGPQGNLTVNGALTLGGGTMMEVGFSQPGTTPGTDFGQLQVAGDVAITNSNLDLFGPNPGGPSGPCPLHVGDTATIVAASGQITGTFNTVADGGFTHLQCQGIGGYSRIHYTAHAITATILARSTLVVTAQKPSGVVNEPVPVTATVDAGGVRPSGTVAFFENYDTVLPGCGHVPVSASPPYTAMCGAQLSRADVGDVSVAAGFTPDNASDAGSVFLTDSSPATVTVAKAATATAVAASPATPAPGAAVTYTATVTPQFTGPNVPYGSVGFTADGAAIAGCEAVALKDGAVAGTTIVTCTTTHPAAGTYAIAATYTPADDPAEFVLDSAALFTGSTSPATSVTVATPSTGGPSDPGTPPSGPSGIPSASGGSPAAGIGVPTAPVVSLAGGASSLTVRSTGVVVTALTCSGTSACTGNATMASGQGGGSRVAAASVKATTVAKSRYSIAAGTTAKIKLKLTVAGKKLLRKAHGKLKVTLTITPSDSGAKAITKKLTLKDKKP
jgi:hypothetical protein